MADEFVDSPPRHQEHQGRRSPTSQIRRHKDTKKSQSPPTCPRVATRWRSRNHPYGPQITQIDPDRFIPACYARRGSGRPKTAGNRILPTTTTQKTGRTDVPLARGRVGGSGSIWVICGQSGSGCGLQAEEIDGCLAAGCDELIKTIPFGPSRVAHLRTDNMSRR